jgi:hypothetical protein
MFTSVSVQKNLLSTGNFFDKKIKNHYESNVILVTLSFPTSSGVRVLAGRNAVIFTVLQKQMFEPASAT